MYRRIVLSEKQNEQPNEKLNEAVVYGDTSRDTKLDGAVVCKLDLVESKANLLSNMLIIFHCKQEG